MEALDIELDDVQVTLGGRVILDHISAQLPAGTSTALLGVSGRGKTTLLRGIGGFDPPLSRGSIRIGSRAPSEHRKLRSLWFLFQEAVPFPDQTVKGHFEAVYHIRELAPDERHIELILEKVGLSQARDLYPHQLSVGMRARLAVGMSFVVPPSVLLADEPFASLDPIRRQKMNEQFSHLQAEFKSTLVWVTHDIIEALQFANQILVLGGDPARIVARIDSTDYPQFKDPARLPPECLEVHSSIRQLLTEDGGQL